MSRQELSPTASSRRDHSPLAAAYKAWFDAQNRCAEAMRAWRSATTAGREAAYHAYLLALDLEEAAAVELARLHISPRLAA
jgi:hypothetical protein